VNLPLLEDIVGKLDVPADSRIVKVTQLVHAEAESLAAYLSEVFTSEQKQAAAGMPVRPLAVSATQPALPPAQGVLAAEQSVQIHPVLRTNHLIIRGYPADLARLEELIAQLDVPEDLETRHYQVVHLSAVDVLSSLQEALGVENAGSTERRGASSRRTGSETRGRGEDSRGSGERIRLSCLSESNAVVVTECCLTPSSCIRRIAGRFFAVSRDWQPGAAWASNARWRGGRSVFCTCPVHSNRPP
jgi:type II secretory pathway component GspD/PulD (secretin)